MSTPELQRLCTILTREQIYELAAECPSLRIPVKKIELYYNQRDFQHTAGKHDFRKLAIKYGVSLATIYNWANCRPADHKS